MNALAGFDPRSPGFAPAPEATLQAALALLKAGRPGEARALLTPLARAQPRLAGARYLLGLALERLGELAAAVVELRAAATLDKRQPLHLLALGDALAEAGDAAGAEKAFRAALALNRRFAAAALSLVDLLLAQGRAAEALQAIAPLAAAPDADESVLAAHGRSLGALGRHDGALGAYERARAAAPGSAVVEHNIAAACGDLMRFPEAEASARRAMVKGSDAPATWLVLARALQGQGRLDPADEAYREALRRRPGDLDSLRGLTQLRWMRSGDLDTALEPVSAALARDPENAAVRLLESSLRDYAGDAEGAYAAADAAVRTGSGVACHIAAARMALALDPACALVHAEAAEAKAPRDATARMALCEARLACGQPEAAADLACALRRERPNDQHVLAYLAAAWRLLGDPRYQDLYDYDAFVRTWVLTPPDGWPTLDAYLAELKAALGRLHSFRAPPLGQSLRQGAQAVLDPLRCEEPAVRALFDAVDGPIRAYIAALGVGKDPLRVRNRGGYAIQGAWSVRLHPGGGRHMDHVHQDGWLSSAFYVDTPAAVADDGQPGWIKFGEPGVPTVPTLEPEHAIKPEPGMLVLFPSYMWHGVRPFGGEASRLTVAFDVVPAKPGRAR